MAWLQLNPKSGVDDLIGTNFSILNPTEHIILGPTKRILFSCNKKPFPSRISLKESHR